MTTSTAQRSPDPSFQPQRRRTAAPRAAVAAAALAVAAAARAGLAAVMAPRCSDRGLPRPSSWW